MLIGHGLMKQGMKHLFKRRGMALAILCCGLVVAACAMPQAEPQAPESPLQAPESPLTQGTEAEGSGLTGADDFEYPEEFEPAEGTGGVRGRLFSSITNSTVSERAIYLPSFLCGPDAPPDDPERSGCFWMHDTNNSPASTTDETGYFEFRDLEPGEYLLLVGDLTWHYAFYESEEEHPIPFTVEEGEITELGNVIVAFPY